MDKSNAIEFAKKHLSENPFPDPKYRWILGLPVETKLGWAFEYEVECVEDIPPEEWDQFGGAPAFVVLENEVRELSWDEWSKLTDTKEEL